VQAHPNSNSNSEHASPPQQHRFSAIAIPTAIALTVTETTPQPRALSEGSLCSSSVQFALPHYPCPSSSPSSAAPAIAFLMPPSFIIVSTPNPAHQHYVNKNTAAPAHPQKTNQTAANPAPKMGSNIHIDFHFPPGIRNWNHVIVVAGSSPITKMCTWEDHL